MMTFVNMHSPGLQILATHRLVNGIDAGQLPDGFLGRAAADFRNRGDRFARRSCSAPGSGAGGRTVIGAAIGRPPVPAANTAPPAGELDVRVLHERLLAKALGIGEEAVRDEKHLRYIRGLDAAVTEARSGAAQIAFLLQAHLHPAGRRYQFFGAA